MKIAFVPLDDRPCNLVFPTQICDCAGVDIISPPKKYLGRFMNPGKSNLIGKWLLTADADVYVISSDMLLYGGLIASRTTETTYKQAIQRLSILSKIKKPVYVFSTIMRLTITASSEKLAQYWEYIMEFSTISDRPGITEDQILELKNKIPSDILSQFLDARARNFKINNELISMADEADIRFLLIGKEDVAQFGLHRKEERDLKKLYNDLNIFEKVRIINGADELGLMMVTRAILDHKSIKPKIFVKYSNDIQSNIISMYEDRSINVVVNDHINAIGATRIFNLNEADLVLYINTPDGKQEDLFLQGSTRLDRALQVQKEIEEIKRLIDEDKLIAVADVAYCNGADPVFAEALLQNIDISKLASFAAWNTTSNTIGSALAFGIARLTAHGSQHTANSLILERFADDYLYQSVVRPKVIKYCKENNISIYNLGDDWKSVEKDANKLMKEEIAQNRNWSLIIACPSGRRGHWSLKLPWPRVFEAGLELKDPNPGKKD